MAGTVNPFRAAAIAFAAVIVAALAIGLATSTWASASGKSRHSDRRQLKSTATVGIRDFAFHPFALTVQRGTQVVFANRDSVRHTATRRGSFSTGKIRPGHSVAVRFQQRGVYRYHCTIHPSMHGKVVVD
jgi:plastocyanin